MAPQASEVWDQEDDWTGLNNAKERRKRQNRIHQRAYRKKRHLKIFASQNLGPQSTDLGATPRTIPLHEQSVNIRRHQSQQFIAVLDRLPVLMLIRCTDIHDAIRDFMQRAYTNWGLNLPTVRDLPNLTRLNTFDALARNALVLQIPLGYLETDDHHSLFNAWGPEPPGEQPAYPTHLIPTQLQKAVPHYSWLDLFPIPGMRDNILRGIEAGVYDEDQLCDALCCDLLNFETGTKALLVVWGESWDAKGWEFSPEFFRRWGVLLQGCPEVLQTTNYWREKRGEVKIERVLN